MTITHGNRSCHFGSPPCRRLGRNNTFLLYTLDISCVLSGHLFCMLTISGVDWLIRWWVRWCITDLVEGLHAMKWASGKSRGPAEIAWHERNNRTVVVLLSIGRSSDLAATSNCRRIECHLNAVSRFTVSTLLSPSAHATIAEMVLGLTPHLSASQLCARSLRSRHAALHRPHAPSGHKASA